MPRLVKKTHMRASATCLKGGRGHRTPKHTWTGVFLMFGGGGSCWEKHKLVNYEIKWKNGGCTLYALPVVLYQSLPLPTPFWGPLLHLHLVRHLFDQSLLLMHCGEGALLWAHFGHRSHVFDMSWRWWLGGGKVNHEGRGGGDGRVLTLDGSRYLMCELSRDLTQWAKQNA